MYIHLCHNRKINYCANSEWPILWMFGVAYLFMILVTGNQTMLVQICQFCYRFNVGTSDVNLPRKYPMTTQWISYDNTIKQKQSNQSGKISLVMPFIGVSVVSPSVKPNHQGFLNAQLRPNIHLHPWWPMGMMIIVTLLIVEMKHNTTPALSISARVITNKIISKQKLEYIDELSVLILKYCLFESQEEISVKSSAKFISFHSNICIWKCHQQEWWPFFSASMFNMVTTQSVAIKSTYLVVIISLAIIHVNYKTSPVVV